MAVTDHPDFPYGEAYAHLWARVPHGSGWYGVAVGPAWAQIVLDADAALAKIDPDYEIHQVKEKYGGLRYYCSLDDLDEAIAIIRAAERRAEHTCEHCGIEGDMVTGDRVGQSGWYKTLCPPCREEAVGQLVTLRAVDRKGRD
jgi:hypothetical protein